MVKEMKVESVAALSNKSRRIDMNNIVIISIFL